MIAQQTGLRNVYAARPETDPLKDDLKYGDARAEALAALNDDLNTPQLVGILNRYSSHRLWNEFDAVLGLGIVGRTIQVDDEVPGTVQALIDERNSVRQTKDWARSDEIRRQLIEMGWDVGDGPAGTTVQRRTV